jgi:nucleotidyltransferase substrate binding protein (TIGR01987 family)
MAEDIRWKQRFSNFEKSLTLLEQALNIEKADIPQKAGIIQFFEMSYELGWKTLKNLLEEQGFSDVASPRSTLKKSHEIGLIADGRAWVELLEDRNLTAPTYDEITVNEVEQLIHVRYFPLLKTLYVVLSQRA